MNSTQSKQMNEIATYYFIYKNHFNVLSFSNGDYDYSDPYYQYYRDVEIAFSRLEEEEKLIIINEFFDSPPVNWWKKIYAKRKEYLASRNRAVENFLKLFHAGS